jgi:hypothetical protein
VAPVFLVPLLTLHQSRSLIPSDVNVKFVLSLEREVAFLLYFCRPRLVFWFHSLWLLFFGSLTERLYQSRSLIPSDVNVKFVLALESQVAFLLLLPSGVGCLVSFPVVAFSLGFCISVPLLRSRQTRFLIPSDVKVQFVFAFVT